MRLTKITMTVCLFFVLATVSSCKEEEKNGNKTQITNSTSINQTQIIQQQPEKKRNTEWEKATNTKGKYTDLSKHDKPLP